MKRRLLLTIVVLVLVLAVAVVAVLRIGGSRNDPEYLLGGPLLAVDPAEISQIIITEGGRQHRLVRGDGAEWSLRGDLHDWVDPLLLAFRLADLARAEGGAVLAGTAPEDRRFEFNGPESVRLTLRTTGGAETRLALGTTNQVTGHVYASGAGRPGCFPVLRETRDLIVRLAQSVRVKSLLPEFDIDGLTAVDLVWGSRTYGLEHVDDRWWLRVDTLTDPLLPPLARAYQQQFADRRRSDDRGVMVQASRDLIRLLVSDVAANQTQGLAPLDETELARVAWGLESIWRRVVLHGPAIDPDPLTDQPDRLEIAFGEPLDEKSMGALRRDLPLLTDRTPLESLERRPGELVDMRALTLQVVDADTVILAGASGVLVRAGQDRDRPVRFDGRNRWDAMPPLPAVGSEREDVHNTARFTVLDLDRMPCLAVLPPTSDAAVLQSAEQLQLTIIWNDPPHREEYRLGVLDLSRLPGGTSVLAEVEGDPGPVGLWRPQDGRLLQIPGGIIITGRNLSR